MHIVTSVQNGITYATVMESHREGGKTRKEAVHYLGRVLDMEHGIYKSRERGVFAYDLETDKFSEAPADFVPPTGNRKTKLQPTFNFGDAFLTESLLERNGIINAVREISYENHDTVMALLFHALLRGGNHEHAKDWFESSYARFLYPKADLSVENIDRVVELLGDESLPCEFLDASPKPDVDSAMLLDLKGYPSTDRFRQTVLQSPNGELVEETRLLWAFDPKSNKPLLFDLQTDDSRGSASVTEMIDTLGSYGVTPDLVITDEDTITITGMKRLLGSGVHFLVLADRRTDNPQRILNLPNSLDTDTAVTSVETPDGRDLAARNFEIDFSNRKLYASMFCAQGATATNGFTFVSDTRLKASETIRLWLESVSVRQTCGIAESIPFLAPIDVRSEWLFRGQILLNLIVQFARKSIESKLACRRLSFDDMMLMMNGHKACERNGTLHPTKPTEKQLDIYNHFEIRPKESYRV